MDLCKKLHKIRLEMDVGLAEEEINRLVDSLPQRKYLGSVELQIITLMGHYFRHKKEGLSDQDAFVSIERSVSRFEGGTGIPPNCSLMEFVNYRVSVAYREKDFVSNEFVATAVKVCAESHGTKWE